MSDGIVVVCGIPGAGKSYFARKFIENLENCGEKRCHLLSFDDFEMPRDKWDDNTFKASRAAAISKIKDIIGVSDDKGDPVRRLVVDDLMYLSSMRHGMYQLARNSMVPMAVVWMNTSLETSLERNSRRGAETMIDPDVIRQIHESFEAPNPASICDRVSYVVAEDEELEKGIEFCVERVNQSIWERLSLRKAELLESRDRDQAVEASKRESAVAGASPINDLDQRLRRIVSLALQKVTPSAKRSLSEHLKHAKARALGLFKEGHEGDADRAVRLFEDEALASLRDDNETASAVKESIMEVLSS